MRLPGKICTWRFAIGNDEVAHCPASRKPVNGTQSSPENAEPTLFLHVFPSVEPGPNCTYVRRPVYHICFLRENKSFFIPFLTDHRFRSAHFFFFWQMSSALSNFMLSVIAGYLVHVFLERPLSLVWEAASKWFQEKSAPSQKYNMSSHAVPIVTVAKQVEHGTSVSQPQG